MTEAAAESVIEAPDTAGLPTGLVVSDNAAKRIAFLIEKEAQPGSMLRLSVLGGGCSGFQYSFAFDHLTNDDDQIFEKNGVKVVVDEMSLEMLAGATLDFVEDLIGASFQIKNPNASASCGCGNSFAV